MHSKVGIPGPLADADRRQRFDEFVHGLVDAQYHIHCYIHNVTWDQEAGDFKALKAERMESRKPLIQERFFSSLARRVFKRGYDVERRSISWDIAQVSPDMIRRHSNRTREVLETAEHLGVHSVEGRAALGATTRQSKKHVPPGFDIAAHLREREPDDMAHMDRLRADALLRAPERPEDSPLSPDERARHADRAVQYGLARALERRSEITHNTVLASSLRWGGAARSLQTTSKGRSTIDRTSSWEPGPDRPDPTHRPQGCDGGAPTPQTRS